MSIEPGERLPAHLRSLADLGRSGDLNMRPVLFRVVCDLFVLKQRHSPDELQQFEEIALRMIEAIDPSLIGQVADRLARHPETPKSVLLKLLGRGDAIAAAVLCAAREVDRDILLEFATFGSPVVARATAARATLEPEVAQILAERAEDDVVLALLDNPGAQLPQATQDFLIRRARHSSAIATRITRRPDLSGEMASLFLAAPPERRAEIILAARRRDLGGPASAAPSATEAADLLRIERLAITRQWVGCAMSLAKKLSCRPDQARLLIEDATGEALALALSAIGMPAMAAARIFMSLDPVIAHSAAQVRTLSHMVDQTPQSVAMRLVSAMLGLSHARFDSALAARVLPSRPQHQGDPGILRQSGETEDLRRPADRLA